MSEPRDWTIPAGTFDALYGLELLEVTDERMRARVPVESKLKHPFGLVHGGVIASIAEALASLGTAIAVMPEGNVAVGSANSTTFLRPFSDGTIHAEATRRHRGRTSWVWDVDVTDDAGRLCATTRMTIAVRPMPAPATPEA